MADTGNGRGNPGLQQVAAARGNDGTACRASNGVAAGVDLPPLRSADIDMLSWAAVS